jgi:hypothetical protein
MAFVAGSNAMHLLAQLFVSCSALFIGSWPSTRSLVPRADLRTGIMTYALVHMLVADSALANHITSRTTYTAFAAVDLQITATLGC